MHDQTADSEREGIVTRGASRLIVLMCFSPAFLEVLCQYEAFLRIAKECIYFLVTSLYVPHNDTSSISPENTCILVMLYSALSIGFRQ